MLGTTRNCTEFSRTSLRVQKLTLVISSCSFSSIATLGSIPSLSPPAPCPLLEPISSYFPDRHAKIQNTPPTYNTHTRARTQEVTHAHAVRHKNGTRGWAGRGGRQSPVSHKQQCATIRRTLLWRLHTRKLHSSGSTRHQQQRVGQGENVEQRASPGDTKSY